MRHELGGGKKILYYLYTARLLSTILYKLVGGHAMNWIVFALIVFGYATFTLGQAARHVKRVII